MVSDNRENNLFYFHSTDLFPLYSFVVQREIGYGEGNNLEAIYQSNEKFIFVWWSQK